MNTREITKGVYYCGVNDRVTEKFEALWPLPNGISYNSYIVTGTEKTALIDTVDIATLPAFANNIYARIGKEKIDYLVINHMEPDHSGSIPLIVELYPDIKIIGNKQTLGMVQGFYHIDPSHFMEVSDGDTIDLGMKSLTFYLTPMVHWPETMVTYIKEDSLLFSGDAFGTFGALNGGVVDSEMECGWYVDEMYRYYSNIVGKYGRFVERAILKLKDVKIEYICPTHGPVWHDKIGEVIDRYMRLAQYKGEDGVTIVYGSMYGNTQAVVEQLAIKLNEKGIRNIKIHNASVSSMSAMINDAFRYKGLIVGSPTYSMTIFPPVDTFMKAMQTREIKNKIFGVFGSFTWAPAAANELLSYAERMKLTVVDSFTMKQSINDETLANIDLFATNFAKAYFEND